MVTLGLKPSILHQIMLYIVTNAQPLTNRWYYNFMSRWSNEVKLVKPRSLEAARASAATKDVDSYFEELNAVINKYHLGDKPQCIFNIDEKGINTDHRPSGVVRDRNTTIQSVRTFSNLYLDNWRQCYGHIYSAVFHIPRTENERNCSKVDYLVQMEMFPFPAGQILKYSSATCMNIL